jgi:acetyl esterase/lipase
MKWLLLLTLAFLLLRELSAQTEPTFSQQEVIYGHKDGMALTMEVLTPKKNANHKGIIFVVSGGWFSTRDWIPSTIQQSEAFLQRGYTVFAVMHGSQPKYTVPEVIPDIERAVRFIRFHAKQYGIDPDFLGITGGSAGAHLSLMVATADDKLDPNAKDSVDRVSGRVQAVACFFPPTDFVNYGKTGANVLVNKTVLDGAQVHAALRFTRWDSTLQYFVPITSLEKRTQIVKQISPIYQVTSDDPPVLIAHGDSDQLVPLQQSERMVQKLKSAKVLCQLIVKKGAGHGWEGMNVESQAFADWFDQHLK